MSILAISEPDHPLLRRAAAGDGAAFDALIGALIEPAYRLALTQLRDPAAAEDVVQEACLQAWRNLGKLRQRSALRSWFLSIVMNRCRSHLRTRWLTVGRLTGAEASPAAFDEAVIRDADLARALNTLSPRDRAILFLHYNLDLPLEEVASAVGARASATRSRLYRALARLRPALEVSEVTH